MQPVTIRADGDEWVVEHDSLARPSTKQRWRDALELARRLHDEEDAPIEVRHPMNVPLRQMELTP